MDKDYFLGGHCLTSHINMTKVFNTLPKHIHLRINAEMHLIDNWEGESVFMLIDE